MAKKYAHTVGRLLYLFIFLAGMAVGVFGTYQTLHNVPTPFTVPARVWGGQTVVKVGEDWRILGRPVELATGQYIHTKGVKK